MEAPEDSMDVFLASFGTRCRDFRFTVPQDLGPTHVKGPKSQHAPTSSNEFLSAQV